MQADNKQVAIRAPIFSSGLFCDFPRSYEHTEEQVSILRLGFVISAVLTGGGCSCSGGVTRSCVHIDVLYNHKAESCIHNVLPGGVHVTLAGSHCSDDVQVATLSPSSSRPSSHS